MKTNLMMSALMILLLALVLPAKMDAQTSVGIHVGVGGGRQPVSSFYVSIGNYYNVPWGDVREMREAGVRDDDMPTILFIYRHSNYSLRQIYSLRLRGASWDNLSNWCGVPLYRDGDRWYGQGNHWYRDGDRWYPNRQGPPYGNAYGHYKNGKGNGRGHGNGNHRGHDDH